MDEHVKFASERFRDDILVVGGYHHETSLTEVSLLFSRRVTSIEKHVLSIFFLRTLINGFLLFFSMF